MKRNILKWTFLLLVAIVGVGFMSCSGNDGNSGTGGDGTTLAGTWEWRDGSDYYRVTIKSDGNYSVTGVIDGHEEKGNGTCYIKDGYLYLTGAGVNKVRVVSHTDKELVLDGWPEDGNCVWVRI